MKISNILMITAVTTLLGSILAYDFKLRDEYQQMYKTSLQEYLKASRFNDYEQTHVKNFTDIDLKAANNLAVTIEYGDKEAVWVRRSDKGMMNVSQNGKKLTIDLSEKGKERNYYIQEAGIIIISPKINRIDAKAIGKVTKYKTEHGGSSVNTSYYNAQSRVSGLKNDSLLINLAANTHLDLTGNHLRTLTAIVGDESGKGNLVFNYGNKIEQVRLNVKNTSTVSVNDSGIKDIEYKLSDGAIVTLRGTELKRLLTK